jgi:hypothetical protein
MLSKPQVIVRLEGLNKLRKSSMSSSGVEPVIFRLAVQYEPEKLKRNVKQWSEKRDVLRMDIKIKSRMRSYDEI